MEKNLKLFLYEKNIAILKALDMEELTKSKLVRHKLNFSMGGITIFINQMLEAGFVEQVFTKNQRDKYLKLTPKGKELLSLFDNINKSFYDLK